MSRLVHLNEQGKEFEKLVNLDGPAREVIRMNGEVRCYYPDAKLVRIEPRTFRNAFPSLSPQQQAALADFYRFRMAERGRVAGIETQAWVFEPKDGLRYGHKFWVDPGSGLLVKARIFDERTKSIEQFAFTEITIGAKIDRDMVNPTWPVTPPDWQVRKWRAERRRIEGNGMDGHSSCRPASSRSSTASGTCAASGTVAHLVYSDGLVAVSVFIEPIGSARSGRPASVRHLPAGRHQRRHPAAGRQSRHRAGRSARRHDPADRAFRRAPLNAHCFFHVLSQEADLP